MSKGLNSLSEMVIHLNVGYMQTRQALEDFRNIEKELKALEIIKVCPFVVNIDYRLEYEEQTQLVKENITKEQYDLLKEVLL